MAFCQVLLKPSQRIPGQGSILIRHEGPNNNVLDGIVIIVCPEMRFIYLLMWSAFYSILKNILLQRQGQDHTWRPPGRGRAKPLTIFRLLANLSESYATYLLNFPFSYSRIFHLCAGGKHYGGRKLGETHGHPKDAGRTSHARLERKATWAGLAAKNHQSYCTELALLPPESLNRPQAIHPRCLPLIVICFLHISETKPRISW